MPRAVDLQYIHENAEALCGQYPGQYALIAGGKLIAVHPTEYHAVMDASHRYSPTMDKDLFGPGGFDVYHCVARGGEYDGSVQRM